MIPDWEFDVLGIYNYRKPGKLSGLFEFLEHRAPKGDICEAGVYRGKTLLSLALWLKERDIPKTVYGFDSFRGLPEKSEKDAWSNFAWMRDDGRISESHYQDVLKRRSYLDGPTSGVFDNVSVGVLCEKIERLQLDNIRIVQGPFEETMKGDYQFCAANIDCDLYESYKIALPFIWERLSEGGYVHLDEYYSLTFPGARLAVDEFLVPKMHPRNKGEFERWYAIKNG